MVKELKSIKVTGETIKNLNKAAAETGDTQYETSEKASEEYLKKVNSNKKKKNRK